MEKQTWEIRIKAEIIDLDDGITLVHELCKLAEINGVHIRKAVRYE